jgi:hypothetical protein
MGFVCSTRGSGQEIWIKDTILMKTSFKHYYWCNHKILQVLEDELGGLIGAANEI